jgi:hypothetical protein
MFHVPLSEQANYFKGITHEEIIQELQEEGIKTSIEEIDSFLGLRAAPGRGSFYSQDANEFLAKKRRDENIIRHRHKKNSGSDHIVN